MFDLYTHQQPAFNAAVAFFSKEEPVPSILVAPTAFGKSVVIAHVVQNIAGKTLVLQPSKELLEQNYKKYLSLGGYATIYSASFNTKRFSNTVYATIGSIKDIGSKFRDLGFTNLIIDEVHLYPRNAESMLANFMQQSVIKKVLGLTATAFKLQSNTDMNGNRFSKLQMLTSKSKMGQFFKEIIHVTQIQELVSLGYWSKIEYELHEFDETGLQYNSAKSDYTDDSLRYNYETQDIEGKILYRIAQLDRRSVLIFVPTIEAAERLASQIPGAYAVHSKLKDKERDAIIDAFKNLRIKYVINVNVLSTGFDHPALDCIINGRKTASLAWHYQMIGRLTRLHPEKEYGLMIDFAGNVDRFGRIEHLYYKLKKTWQVYGEGGRLLTGIPMHSIGEIVDGNGNGAVLTFGKWKGYAVDAVPKTYLQWMIKEIGRTPNNEHILDAAAKILETA